MYATKIGRQEEPNVRGVKNRPENIHKISLIAPHKKFTVQNWSRLVSFAPRNYEPTSCLLVLKSNKYCTNFYVLSIFVFTSKTTETKKSISKWTICILLLNDICLTLYRRFMIAKRKKYTTRRISSVSEKRLVWEYLISLVFFRQLSWKRFSAPVFLLYLHMFMLFFFTYSNPVVLADSIIPDVFFVVVFFCFVYRVLKSCWAFKRLKVYRKRTHIQEMN